MGMMKEFKEFAMKGNLVDMAIAFVMGGAFGKVTTSFIEGIVMPIVGKLTGGVDFSKMQYKIKDAELDAAGKETAAAVFIKYGAFITTVVDFIVVAFVMFMVIKGINKMKKKEEIAPAAPPAPTATETLLAEIRDALKK
ncbi:MAG: large-conductance mechanosensitive channel protein MscL [Bacteroidetes bacterium]|jgi:large conductance mechanosensitive channel|nr:large-conductance mechanosensitive channel protein MscL [Bacteroidota bacterium]